MTFKKKPKNPITPFIQRIDYTPRDSKFLEAEKGLVRSSPSRCKLANPESSLL